MEPADPYQAPNTSEWLDEEPRALDDGRSARLVGRLALLYVIAVCGLCLVGLWTLANRSSGPPLISGFPRWTLARFALAGGLVVGWGLSVATYTMQRAQGRPLYAGIASLLGVLSGGLLLVPLLAFGPTSPKRIPPERTPPERIPPEPLP